MIATIAPIKRNPPTMPAAIPPTVAGERPPEPVVVVKLTVAVDIAVDIAVDLENTVVVTKRVVYVSLRNSQGNTNTGAAVVCDGTTTLQLHQHNTLIRLTYNYHSRQDWNQKLCMFRSEISSWQSIAGNTNVSISPTVRDVIVTDGYVKA
jgi:hypothetical protein